MNIARPPLPALFVMLGLLAGCASFPTVDAPSAAASSGTSERYRLVAPLLSPAGDTTADEALPMARQLAVRQVSSSSRAGGAADDALADGDLKTAWAPADGDAAPYAVFDLQDCGNLSGLTLRVSDGVTLEVAVGSPDGWKVIASGLTPEAGKLDWLPLRPTDAAQVRLLFSGPGVAHLRVSEVTWYGRRCGGDLPLFQPLPSRAPYQPPADDPQAGVAGADPSSATVVNVTVPDGVPPVTVVYVPIIQAPTPDPTPTPSPSASPSPSPSPTASPSPEASPSPSPSPSADSTPSPEASPTPTPTPKHK